MFDAGGEGSGDAAGRVSPVDGGGAGEESVGRAYITRINNDKNSPLKVSEYSLDESMRRRISPASMIQISSSKQSEYSRPIRLIPTTKGPLVFGTSNVHRPSLHARIPVVFDPILRPPWEQIKYLDPLWPHHAICMDD